MCMAICKRVHVSTCTHACTRVLQRVLHEHSSTRVRTRLRTRVTECMGSHWYYSGWLYFKKGPTNCTCLYRCCKKAIGTVGQSSRVQVDVLAVRVLGYVAGLNEHMYACCSSQQFSGTDQVDNIVVSFCLLVFKLFCPGPRCWT